jgi:thiol-disulfide isomerase/thioredoxin
MRRIRIALTLLVSLYGAALFAQKPVPADQLVENGKVRAAQQGKLIFLVFGASWCGPCHELDTFMEARGTRPVLEKYFVVVKLNVEEKVGKHPELETPGGLELAVKLGGDNDKSGFIGLPFIVFLDAVGKPIVNSIRPVKGHPGGAAIGYPSAPEEIDWFMTMLKKAVPTMTAEESRTIEEWLRKASAK